MLQLGDRGLDVVEGPVDFLFVELDAVFGLHKHLPGADVQHTVVQLQVELRPPLLDKVPVIVDAVARQDCRFGAELLFNQGD